MEAQNSYTYRVAGLEQLRFPYRPFRAPHHTCSEVALRGSFQKGHVWHPGEISLAHGGVLFLDELPEFRRTALEHVMDALQRGSIRLSGPDGTCIQIPARFRLICAMNPCPCGWRGSDARACGCTAEQVQRYLARVPSRFADVCRPVEPAEWAADVKRLLAAEAKETT